MERDELILINTIRLADDHRKHCSIKNGEDCGISLIFLLELLERAGITVTKEQVQHFM